jgi:hypothetical protein
MMLVIRCSSSGVGATAAVEGDDRVSGADADRHENMSHNGSSGFGGNADSVETADLRPCMMPGPTLASIISSAALRPPALQRGVLRACGLAVWRH